MSVKLLVEDHLEFLNLKGGSAGSWKSTLVKMPHYWKSHVPAHIVKTQFSLSLVIINKKGLSSIRMVSKIDYLRQHMKCWYLWHYRSTKVKANIHNKRKYSKTSVKRPFKYKQNKDLNDKR